MQTCDVLVAFVVVVLKLPIISCTTMSYLGKLRCILNCITSDVVVCLFFALFFVCLFVFICGSRNVNNPTIGLGFRVLEISLRAE